MKRTLAALLAALFLTSSAGAVEPNWLIPPIRDYAPFTDTAGTICETAAGICCRAGLMDGVDSRHFYPQSGLTYAQIIVISARLHCLLSGKTLEYFEPISRTGADWWTPYDSYLRQEIPALSAENDDVSMTQLPTCSCSRGNFLELLSFVLTDCGTVLPEINSVSAVPDCQDSELIAFYRWGILGGKDAYGTLYAQAALSRGAAAAMLARLIDPAQRLVLNLQPLELCQDLLGVDPDTVVMTIGKQPITAQQFVPTLVSTCSNYNHSHFAAMMMDLYGRTTLDEALDTLRFYILCEELAQELELELTPSETVYQTGYRGLTAQGQTWTEEHARLLQEVQEAVGALPEDRLPEISYAPVWETRNLSNLNSRVRSLPYWGGNF